jgi:cytoskeletal protein CcmA (bactofilin family)
MLSSFKGNGPDTNRKAAASELPKFMERAVPPRLLPAEPSVVKPQLRPESVSLIPAGMCIAGQVVCTGSAQVFGRVEGELRVSELLLGEGSQVEGTIIAQEVTVRGHVKGTIRAVRVRLEDGATVEGDIFHRSLSIVEGTMFDGLSRRVENPTDAPVSIPEEIPQKPSMPSRVLPGAAPTDSQMGKGFQPAD